MFATADQQDAHEFLLEYVNQLHDELLAARIKWLLMLPESVLLYSLSLVVSVLCFLCLSFVPSRSSLSPASLLSFLSPFASASPSPAELTS